MATVLDIANGAAEEIGVKTAEIPLEPEDYQVIITRMNDLLTEWADLGLTPQFKEVLNSTDTVDIDRNAVYAAKLELAMRISLPFQKPITDALRFLADRALRKLESSAVGKINVAYPDSLPVGSGNEFGDINERFYPQNPEHNF